MTVIKDSDGFRLQFDQEIPEDERRFYLKVYPTVNVVSERKVHCTVCGVHIGTAPANESIIRMHPILKVTHCKKCHEFYNSGEFSKGEDGSELYCRWCGQGGEVYCCSKCPYVFCTNCIVQNLSKECVNDIEENENWNCFVCAPKIMWHLRAQHWALMNFIEKQKQNILDTNLAESVIKKLMTKDLSTCCKSKSGNVSDSSCDSESSTSRKRKAGAAVVDKKVQIPRKIVPKIDEDSPQEVKKMKLNNEVVCTPDVLSLISQDASTNPPKVASPGQQNSNKSEVQQSERQRPPPLQPQSLQSSLPRQIQIQPAQTQLSHGVLSVHPPAAAASFQLIQPQANLVPSNPNSQAPPLAIRTANSTGTAQLRGISPTVAARKTVVGNRPASTAPGQSPVYHTINGYRIDLNTAAQQETFRLPNGKLIQVKRQGTTAGAVNTSISNAPGSQSGVVPITSNNQNHMTRPPPNLAQLQQAHRNIQPAATILNSQIAQHGGPIQQFTIQQPSMATIRYAPATGPLIGANANANPNGVTATASAPPGAVLNPMMNGSNSIVAIRPAVQQPTLIKHIFASTPLGQIRSQLQNQIFTSMDICHHLTGKIHTLTNSNAYKTARNYTDVKELYIHLSYLFTYAIGRFKTLQEKCMDDMRSLGFAGDAATLESGQLEKYSSDNDEDDIVIVEPKTTLIDLDSDNEDDPQSSRNGAKSSAAKRELPALQMSASAMAAGRQATQQIQHLQIQQPTQVPPMAPLSNKPPPLVIKPVGTVTPPIGVNIPAVIRPVEIPQSQLQQPHLAIGAESTPQSVPSPTPSLAPVESMECDLDFTANLLAGMLDVELHEGSEVVQIATPPKKPRKKTTNKPNPHLIKQQQIQARERERERIKHDAKLKMKCTISLERIEETSESVKNMLDEYMENYSKELSSNGGKAGLVIETDDATNEEVNKQIKETDGTELKEVTEKKIEGARDLNSKDEVEQNDLGRKQEGSLREGSKSEIDGDEVNAVDLAPSEEPKTILDEDTASFEEEESIHSDTSETPKDCANSSATIEKECVEAGKVSGSELDLEKHASPKNKDLVDCDAIDNAVELSALISAVDDENEKIELLEVIDAPDDETSDLTNETSGVKLPLNSDQTVSNVKGVDIKRKENQSSTIDSTTTANKLGGDEIISEI